MTYYVPDPPDRDSDPDPEPYWTFNVPEDHDEPTPPRLPRACDGFAHVPTERAGTVACLCGLILETPPPHHGPEGCVRGDDHRPE